MPKRIPPYTNNGPCAASQPDSRPSPSRRGYGSIWQRTRLLKLAADPLCESCLEAGLEVPAAEVDHVLAISRGGTHDPDNLRSLCKPCHSRKTCATDGGLGRPRG